jgi:hypothetical protein
MDINDHFERRMQQYESFLREAEERRLARDVGMPDCPDLELLRPMASGLWGWLSQLISPEVANSDESIIRNIRYGG